jgi:hypothetical protein
MTAMGHFQTSGLPQAKVRSSLNNGHVATASACRFRANKRLMHRSKELKLFDHFAGAGEEKMRDCDLALMQPEDSVHGA